MQNSYSKVHLRFSLTSVDTTLVGFQNIFVLLILKENDDEALTEQTEPQKYAEKIIYNKVIEIDYDFTVTQKLKFEIYEKKADNQLLFIGDSSITLGKIICSDGQVCKLKVTSQLESHKNICDLIVKNDFKMNNRQFIKMGIKAYKLKKKKGLWKRNPKIRISRVKEDKIITLYESETANSTCEVRFNNFNLRVPDLCDVDFNREFIIECFDFSSKKNKLKLMGEARTTVDRLRVFPDMDLDKGGKSKGKVQVQEMEIFDQYEFMDFVESGLRLNLTFAVDLTSSNGSPNQPDTLHCIVNKKTPNEYQNAMYSICNALLKYTTDEKIGVYGFGAKPSFPNLTQSQVSQAFPLTGEPDKAFVTGFSELMECYYKAVSSVQMWGPSVLHEVIAKGKEAAKETKDKNIEGYHVLVVLTDGELYDFDASAKELKECASLPISVLFVGVGKEDFDNIKQLSRNNVTETPPLRECGQFVAMRDYKDLNILTRDLLSKIPQQVCQYLNQLKKIPSKIKEVDESKIGYTIDEDIDPAKALESISQKPSRQSVMLTEDILFKLMATQEPISLRDPKIKKAHFDTLNLRYKDLERFNEIISIVPEYVTKEL